MLANLTSLLWGRETAPATTTTTSSPDSSNTKAALQEGPEALTKFNFRATTPTDEEEADWVLVDRAEVGGGVEPMIASATATTASTVTTTTTFTTTTTTTTASPAAISTPPVSPVTLGGEWSEGGTQGWLMTPPPCFTRSQAAPLATSPLENLLIEHPSMSVYLPRPTYTSAAIARIFPQRVKGCPTPSSRSSPSASPSSQPALTEREDSPMKENTDEEAGSQAVEVPTGRGVTQRAPSLLLAIDVLRPAQKAQRRREERRLKRTPLERSNKAREVAAAGNKRAKRCDMMLPGKFSRAVNNRKC